MIPFGTQLIGQTEKALTALLCTVLLEHGLTEEQWIALRLAGQHGGEVPLVDFVRDGAYLPGADAVVDGLRERGLVEGDGPSERGREFLARIGAQIQERTAPIWAALDPAAVAGAEQVLNTVLERTRGVLAARPHSAA